MSNYSKIWPAFTKVNNITSICLECNKTHSCLEGNTSSLGDHLKLKQKNINSSLLNKDKNIS